MDMLSGKRRVSLIVISYPFNQWYLATGLTNETELLKLHLTHDHMSPKNCCHIAAALELPKGI